MENETPKIEQPDTPIAPLEHRVNDALQPLLIWVEATQFRLDLISLSVSSMNRGIMFNRLVITGLLIMTVAHMVILI